jgi:phosphate transport system permease protein
VKQRRSIFSRLFEKIIEGTLTISSTVTSLTVLLIIIFLFKEGFSLFGDKPIEKNFVLAVNKSNPISKLKPESVKDIFDEKITNWKDVGGFDKEIKTFTINDISKYFTDAEIGDNFEFLPKKINELVASELGIIAYIPTKYLSKDFSGKNLNIGNVTVGGFISGKQWFPTSEPIAQLGVLPLIMGTIWVCLGAILLALPLGLACAIYMSEVAHIKIRNILKPIIELLSGIPSVVYGFFGLIIIVPLVKDMFNLPVGETALAGSIILAIMVLPTIITIAEDALRTTPNSMREASLALGATKLQTIVRVVVPHSILGITAAAILGIGRVFGETMAVLMVTGNAAVMPNSFLQPIRTITATIAAELGEAPQGGLHYKALFALGCILFIITLITNLLVEWVSSKRKYSKS